MSKPPTFSFSSASGGFGSSGTNNTSGDTNQPPSGGGLFGSSTAPASGPSNLFGSVGGSSAPSRPSLFGTSTGNTPSLFGAAATPSTSTGGGTTGSGSLFGAASTPSTSAGGGTTSGVSLFGNLTTPNKNADASKPAQPSLFGSGMAASNPFAPMGPPSANPQAGSTTPAPSKTSNIFGNLSTTPAGPPPSTNTGANGGSTSLFANLHKPAENKPASNIFGNLGKPAQSPAQTLDAPKFPPVFATQSNDAASVGTKSPFSLGIAGPASNTAMTGNPTLSFPSTAANSSNAAPAASQNPFPGTAASLFTLNKPPNAAPNAGNPFTLGGTSASTMPPSSLAAPSPIPAAPAISTSGGPAPSFLNGLGSTSQATSSSQPASTPAAAPSLFAPKSIQPASTATAAPSLFAPNPFKPAATQPAQSGTTALNADNPSKPTALGASTTGPKPPAKSRLQNKSMDEIITRWASDLTKYQKEFQKQADKVSEWDRQLVENSEKVQKLYGSTLEAERATQEVERQLTAVENDQSEIEYWLDSYEKQVDELMAQQGSAGESLQGPDAERERTFKLAERLSDRLTEMGKDLTSMVDEINDASSNLSRNSTADDPLSQIVRVLNGHLSQLQMIDQGTAALQDKVAAAQKSGRNLGSSGMGNGYGSDAAADFYRSYMGRRS